jgi:hypothetical protein
MDILRNLFGNVTSGIIRLAVAVGVLGAAYLFIVKPVMDTTNNAIDSANKTFEKSFGTTLDMSDLDKTIENVNRRVQVQIRRSFHTAKRHGGGDPQKLVRCIQRASGDVHRIQRCTIKY